MQQYMDNAIVSEDMRVFIFPVGSPAQGTVFQEWKGSLMLVNVSVKSQNFRILWQSRS